MQGAGEHSADGRGQRSKLLVSLAILKVVVKDHLRLLPK